MRKRSSQSILKSWVSTLALTAGVVTFLGAFPDINTFAVALGEWCCSLFGQPPNCLPGYFKWIIFAFLVAACTVVIAVVHRLIAQGIERTRLSSERKSRARANYLSYLEKEIAGRLSASLPRAVVIPIKSYETPGAVEPRYRSVEKNFVEKELSPIEAFEAFEHRILILGEAGSGKSTVLYEIAQRLVDAAKRDISTPIPILVTLSSFRLTPPEKPRVNFRVRWFQSKKESSGEDFDRWLVDRLVELRIGDLKQPIAEDWISEGNVALLLDGFDEVSDSLQPFAANAINASDFFSEFRTTPAVICSRSASYDRLRELHGIRFLLNAAVTLQPLTTAEVAGYLQAIDQPKILEALDQHQYLQPFAETPLNVNLLVNAFEEIPPATFADEFSEVKFKADLVDTLVSKLVQREKQRPASSPDSGRHNAKAYTLADLYVALESVAFGLVRRGLTQIPLDRMTTFVSSGKAGPSMVEAMAVGSLMLLTIFIYAVLSFSGWIVFASLGSFTLRNVILAALLLIVTTLLLVLWRERSLWIYIFTAFGVGTLQRSLEDLASLSANQSAFTLIALCFISTYVIGGGANKRGQTVGTLFILVYLTIFSVLSVTAEKESIWYLVYAAVPAVALAFAVGPGMFAVLAFCVITFSQIKVSGEGYLFVFLESSLAGLIYGLIQRSVLVRAVHFATTLGGLALAGGQGGIIGASLWPLTAIYLKGERTEWLNYFWESRIESPFILRMLSAGEQIPSKFPHLLEQATKADVLKRSGNSYEFRHPLIRDHFALRRYIRSLSKATSTEKLAFVTELAALGELAGPVLHEMAKDQNLEVARAARTAHIDLAVNNFSVASADRMLMKPGDLAPNLARPRIVGLPSDLETPVVGRDREIEEALTALTGTGSARIFTVVAPPGYGKTALLRGVLQKVITGGASKRYSVPGIICLDARHELSLEAILLAVATLTGRSSLIRVCFNSTTTQEKLEVLWTCLAESAPLWLVLENVELVLDEQGTFRNEELNLLLEGWSGQQKRSSLIIESSVCPKLKHGAGPVGRELGSSLVSGLREKVAIAWVQEIGISCGVDQEPEEAVCKLVELFHGVPQWIEVAVGVLIAEQPSRGLQTLLTDKQLLPLFQSEDPEHWEQGLVCMVNRIVAGLSADARMLLGFVASFPFAVPLQAIATVLPDQEFGDALDKLVQMRMLHKSVDRSGNQRYLMPSCLQQIVSQLSLWQPDVNAAQRLFECAKKLGRDESDVYAAEVWRCAHDCFAHLSNDDADNFSVERPISLSKRASLFTSVGRVAEAIPLHLQAIALLDSLPKADKKDEELARALIRLSNTYYYVAFIEESQCEVKKAIELLQALVDAGRKELEPELGTALSSQAVNLLKGGRKDDAFKLMAKARELLQRAVAADNHDWDAALANVIRNMGISLLQTNLDDALRHFTDARCCYEQITNRGPYEEVWLAKALRGEWDALDRLGRHEEALRLAEREIEILKELVAQGYAHCELILASSALEYAKRLYAFGKYDAANPFFEIAHSHYQALFDRGAIDDAGQLLETVVYAAYSFIKCDQGDKALPLHQLSIDSLQVTPERAYTSLSALARALWSQGDTLRKVGRSKEALKIYARSITCYDRALNIGDSNCKAPLAQTLIELSETHIGMKKSRYAAPFLQRAEKLVEEYAQVESAYKPKEVAKLYMNLSAAFFNAKEHRKARKAIDRVISICEKLVSNDHDSHIPLAVTLYGRALIYSAQFRFFSAAADLRRAFRILKQEIEKGSMEAIDQYARLKNDWYIQILMRLRLVR